MTDIYTEIRLAAQGDKLAEQKVVNANLPLVHSCVRKLIRSGCEYDDLLQVGSIGLVKAIRNFDPELGYKLSTYAVPLIMGEIKRYMRDNSMLKVSRSYRELWGKAVSAREALTSKLGREPKISEIAKACDTSVERLTLAMEACTPCESLQQKVGGGEKGDIYLADILSGSSSDDELEKIALRTALGQLGERDKKIIIMRYFRGKTQTEVSREIGVSQVQISRIEKKVLQSLRKALG